MPSASTSRRHAVAALLFCLLVLLWGVNWPVIKQVVALMPPLWAGVIRTAGAAICLIVLQLVRGRLAWPARGDLPVLASSGLAQMALSNMLVNLALQQVPAGRSAVMLYTIPLWAIPIAALWLGEAITVARMAGLALGVGGLLLLFNPASFDWANGGVVLGNGLLLMAAVATAGPIVHMRKHRWRGSPGDLAPWQCAVAAAALLPLAWGMEGPPAIAWSPRLALLLAYATLPCTAFAFWALTWISKELPAMTTSLGLLGVPLVGVASASIELGEPLTPTLVGALALIAGGVAVGTLGGRAKHAATSVEVAAPRS
jgi:drug/metabolite transporter (DMT)-like permease